MLLAVLSGCADRTAGGDDFEVFTSFRDIPGITEDEINAIELLQRTRNNFRLSSIYGTEMFVGEDGRIAGFSAHLCRWLSELFEIPFVPSIVDWDGLIEGLENKTIDFTGELASNYERRQIYYMTGDIAVRQVITLRMVDALPLQEIAEERILQFGFLRGDPIADIIARVERHEFEAIEVGDNLQAYEMLVSGEIDAFFNENSAEAAFGFFDDVVASIYYPIRYIPVSLSTQNSDLSVIIDVVDKALENGAIHYLTMLYNQGHQDYLRHKFIMMLTDEERDYIRVNPIIPFAAEYTNYPISFFDSRSGEWDGIAIDVLREIEDLTGLVFERINDESMNWSELLRMLEDGQAAVISSLIPSDDRIGEFIWPGENFFLNHLALISKTEFRDIRINEILLVRVGTVRDTAHGAMFHYWFPNHRSVTVYDTTYDAFDALERDEIDMVMVSEHQLLILTNYREEVGYKANYVFDYNFYSTFGLNKDREVLASIITKAMRVIDVESISGRWLRRTYDFRVQMAQERIPFMVGVGVLTAGLIFAVILFVRKRKEGLKLETLVDIRTKELSDAVEVAQKASRAKSDFLSSMSHEIRTPMNAIIGMAELLGHEDLNVQQTGYVHDITVSSKSLLGIINDILDFSKIESGKLELNPADFDLMALIDQIDSMFTYVAQNKNLEFFIETADDLPECLFGDDVRIRQVLINILGNAVKFTEKGHIKLIISVDGETLLFKIEDTGVGIRKEDMPKLFKAFEQLDKVKNKSVVGTGLGLSITKAFVEMMGGKVAIDSEYGVGTVFTVAIPLVAGNAENIRHKETKTLENAISAPDAKILVTDDNEFNLKVASGLLNFMDIEAEIVDSGAKAIELIKRNDYDIIFMDHMMPEMDGVETVQEIRKLGGKFEDIIIVALTANAVSGAREMFLSNGFNDFISKPIDAGGLQELVKRYLPPEKVKVVDAEENKQAILDKGDQLRKKSILTFVKENKDTYKEITSLLSAGDIKTAHRIAHTLKSSSGYLGKTKLQEAAFSLEKSLHGENPRYTPDQLSNLERELSFALREFRPIVDEAEREKPDVVQIDVDELRAMLTELKPLLESADFGASSYVEKLQGIEGMEELAERIDDYDFDSALELLNTHLT